MFLSYSKCLINEITLISYCGSYYLITSKKEIRTRDVHSTKEGSNS